MDSRMLSTQNSLKKINYDEAELLGQNVESHVGEVIEKCVTHHIAIIR